MRRKYVSNIIAWIVVIALVVAVIQFRDTPRFYYFKNKVLNFFRVVTDFLRITKHNVAVDFSPEGRVPANLIVQETQNCNKLQPEMKPYSPLLEWTYKNKGSMENGETDAK